ncbi:protein RUFY3 isoform X1 [Latimeria chalumnae]|uniref:protein RUFY3 isoform X1 n=2 Tax=Latimeria chalumnae TaxID=7897 RepID=UPI0003C1053A|nr:PREDICTED: protein RUFY3 isoform X1 [Latimeria chalumnae]|eukprot:XP_006003787.1 PREDICTED: protein RUFY3 isoform X1 [Latimeria chalumnae]
MAEPAAAAVAGGRAQETREVAESLQDAPGGGDRENWSVVYSRKPESSSVSSSSSLPRSPSSFPCCPGEGSEEPGKVRFRAPERSPPVSPTHSNNSKRSCRNPKDPIAIERLNLMNMAKLSIKGLIESALNLGRTLDSDYPPLQQFFVVMEHCLKHGLKTKKTFLVQNKSFWGPLELVEKLTPEAGEITASVKDLPGLKTPSGRGRAWLRLALMQKKLSDYMKALINRKDLLSEFYEPNALMMEEEGAVIAGLLVGLNVIDANLCMKGEDLDSQVGVIDFSMYLKDGGHSSKNSEGDGQITAILDQKNYVEELNRHLNATVNNLQAKVDALEKSNTKLTEELAVANNRIITLQEEVERVKEASSYILESNRKVTKQDGTADGNMFSEARKQLKEETQLRLDVEKELEVQIGMRQEMELAMKMLDKDVCEKQDALVALRQQLDDLRAFNYELVHKEQGSETAMKQKNEIISRLEEKTSQMATTIKQLEQRLRQVEKDRQSAEDANRLFKQDFGDKIDSLQLEVDHLAKQRVQLEVELKRERERRSILQNGNQGDKTPPTHLKNYQQELAELRKEFQKIETENLRLRKALEERDQVVPDRSSSQQEDQQMDQPSKPKEPVLCKLCQVEASLTKRKNLCKNCGEMVCETCSVNELPLPSSIQPERVCNLCHAQLLQRYSTSPS